MESQNLGVRASSLLIALLFGAGCKTQQTVELTTHPFHVAIIPAAMEVDMDVAVQDGASEEGGDFLP